MESQLTCREFVEFLADYVAGDLPPDQTAVFKAHLALCPACVSYATTYLETVRLGRASLLGDASPVPLDMPEELVTSILAARLSGS